MKLKEIKESYAKDITNISSDELKKLIKEEKELDKVGVSIGTYGKNGALFKGRTTKELYKITKRNANLFYLV